MPHRPTESARFWRRPFGCWRLVLKCLSLTAIGNVLFYESRWAAKLYRDGLLLFIPLALVVPALQIWFFVGGIKELPPEDRSSAFYKGIRRDLLKFVIITGLGMLLVELQSF